MISDDKYKVYHGRDKLRLKGIRISDDLTKAQRAQLNSAKSRGVIAYFYKGQLFERESNRQNEPNEGFRNDKSNETPTTRFFRKATRRVMKVPTLKDVVETQRDEQNSIHILNDEEGDMIIDTSPNVD